MIDFNEKTVLVTGGGAGIGFATADAFAKAGARLAILEIDADRAATIRQTLESAGVAALVVQGDATDPAAVATLAEQIDARFGGLDVLVNNVGDFLLFAKPFETYSDDEIERSMPSICARSSASPEP